MKCLVVKKWEAGRLVASLIIRTHNQSNVRIRQPILSPGKFKKIVHDYIQIDHGCVKSTVIERRQHQLGRMADFPPPVTFSVFDS